MAENEGMPLCLLMQQKTPFLMHAKARLPSKQMECDYQIGTWISVLVLFP